MVETMKAEVTERRGPAKDSLVFHSDWPRPVRKEGQVLVHVVATSVNAGDWKMRKPIAPIPMKLPKILGSDVAGVVVEAPEESKFKAGDKVFGDTGQQLKAGDAGGAYGEYVAADEATLAHMPPGVSFEQAAATPLAAMTAWQALARGAPLAGKRVLVIGGSSGVGHFGVQIAKAQGAYVIATASTRNLEFVKGLGADEVVDYTQGPIEQQIMEPVDFVLDVIGGPYESAGFRLLRPDGSLAGLGGVGHNNALGVLGMVGLLAGLAWKTLLGKLGIAKRFHWVMLRSVASEGLEQVGELMALGKVKAHIDREWPLEELVAAHEYAEQGHTVGKVLIRVRASPA